MKNRSYLAFWGKDVSEWEVGKREKYLINILYSVLIWD